MINVYKKDGTAESELLQNSDINIQELDGATIVKCSNGIQFVYANVSVKNLQWSPTAQMYYSSGYVLYPAAQFKDNFCCLVQKSDDNIAWIFKTNIVTWKL